MADKWNLASGDKKEVDYRPKNQLAKLLDLEAKLNELLYDAIVETDHVIAAKLNAQITQVEKEIQKIQAASSNKKVWEKVIKIIKTHCSRALSTYIETNTVLFRGASGPDVFIGKSHDNRTSRNSTANATYVFDECLRRCGSKALRSNSIFTSSNFEQARYFGEDVFVIFPFDDANFLFTAMEDIVITRHTLTYSNHLIRHKALLNLCVKVEKLTHTEHSKKYTSFLQYFGDADRQMDFSYDPYAIANQLIVDGFEEAGKLVNKFFKTGQYLNIAGFKEHYKPNFTDFKAGVVSGNEVCINGRYLAIERSKARSLAPLLGIKI